MLRIPGDASVLPDDTNSQASISLREPTPKGYCFQGTRNDLLLTKNDLQAIYNKEFDLQAQIHKLHMPKTNVYG